MNKTYKNKIITRQFTFSGLTKNGSEYRAEGQVSAEGFYGSVNLRGCAMKCEIDKYADLSKNLFLVIDRNYITEEFKIISKIDGCTKLLIPAADECADLYRETFALVKISQMAVDQELEDLKIEEAKNYTPVGFYYTFGCDYPDSFGFKYSDDTPNELFSYISRHQKQLHEKYFSIHDIFQLREEGKAVEHTDPNFSTYGGVVFSLETYHELADLSAARKKEVDDKKRAEEEAAALIENEIKEAAGGRQIISIENEGGAYLINYRLDKSLWSKLKAIGAYYYSADDLEEFDMFYSEPGWRYSKQAIAELINNDFAVRLDNQVYTDAKKFIKS